MAGERNERNEQQSPTADAIDSGRFGVRALGAAARAAGTPLPGAVGQFSRAAGVVSEALNHPEAGIVENVVCGTASVVTTAVVSTPLIVAAGARAAAALPTPDPWSRAAAGAMGAMGAAPAVNEAVRPLGDAVNKACRSLFNRPGNEAREKAASDRLIQKYTQNQPINHFKPHSSGTTHYSSPSLWSPGPYRPYSSFQISSEISRILLHYPGLSTTERLSIQRRAEFAASFMTSGFGYSVLGSDFHSSLSITGLINSYNSYNLQSLVREALNSCTRDPGGVTGDSGLIQTMIDSEAHAEAHEYFLCFKLKDFPFDKSLLKQIEKELYSCYFNHKTLPFFSLHFNNQGFCYPVMHPVLQNTLTGQVIAFLDYWMKGFLNGGVFNEEFLKCWHLTQNCDESTLRASLIDLEKYCKEHLKKMDYMSLRELESRYGIKENKANTSTWKQPFMVSFRIIAFMKDMAVDGNILVPTPDFRIEYTIDPMPDYEAYMQKYYRDHGEYPPEYEQMRRCYVLYAEEIREKLPQLPFCRDYFQLLGMINTYSYVYTTFEKMGKRPIIPETVEQNTYAIPNAFPSIPVRYFKQLNINLDFEKIFKALGDKDKAHLDSLLKTVFDNRNIDTLPESYIQQLKNAIYDLLPLEAAAQIASNESFEINVKEAERFIQKAERFIYAHIVHEHEAINRSIFQDGLDFHHDIPALKKLPLSKKLDMAKNLLNKYELIAKTNWEQKEALTLADIQAPFAPTLHPEIQQIFQNLDKSFQSDLDYIIYYCKKAADTLTDKERQNPPADHNQLKELQTKIALGFTEEYKTISTLIEMEIVTFEKQLQESRDALELPLKIQQKIDAISAFKKSQIDQIPPAAMALNAANIATFSAPLDAEINKLAGIKIEIESKIPDIQKDIVELTAAIQSYPVNKIKKLQKAKQDLLDATIDMYKKNSVLAKEKIYQKKALEILKTVSEQTIKTLDGHTETISHFHTLLCNNKDFTAHAVAKKYSHTGMTFTAKNLAEKTGDKYHIVGGCGLSLPQLSAKSLDHAQPFTTALAKSVIAGHDEFVFNGEKYLVSNLPVVDAEKMQTVPNKTRQALTALMNEDASQIPILESLQKNRIDASGSLSLHYAAAMLDATTFNTLAKDDINTPDFLGNTALHFAAQAGNEAVLTSILTRFPDKVECKNHLALTPLFLAIQYGQGATVEKLLAFKANINQKLPNGLFPLYVALQKNHADIALWILNNVPNVAINETIDSYMTALHLAIEGDHDEIALKLISMKAQCDIKRKADGFNAMHLAVKKGKITVLKAMATQSVSFETLLESGKNSLHIAALSGQLACLHYLIERKVDCNVANLDGETPLMLAIKSGHTDVANILASISAINTQNTQQQTASLLSLQYNMPHIGDILIARGENPELRDIRGLNYVYFLVRNGEESRFSALKDDRKINLHQEYELPDTEACRLDKIQNAMESMMPFSKKDASKKQTLNLLELAARYGQFLIVYDLEDTSLSIRKNKENLSLLEYAIIADELGFVRENITKLTDFAKLARLAAQHGAVRCLAFLLTKCTQQQIEKAGVLQASLASGNVAVLEQILDLCKDIHKPLDKKGNTILHLAALAGETKGMELLLSHGSDPEHRNHQQQTPFHIALQQKQAPLLKRLLKLTKPSEWPADLWQINQSDNAIHQILETFRKRLPKTVHTEPVIHKKETTTLSSIIMNDTLTQGLHRLQSLFEQGSYDTAADLIEDNPVLLDLFTARQGADLLLQMFSHLHDYKRIFKKNAELAEKMSDIAFKAVDRLLSLLGKKINPALYRGRNNVLLAMIRAEDDEEACYRLSVFNRYFPQSVKELALDTWKGETSILNMAIHINRPKLLKALEDVCKDEDIEIPFLHEAVKANHYDLVQDLLKRYSADTRNMHGHTPFMLAAAQNNVMMMELFLFHGINPDSCDKAGKNALHHALESKAEEAALRLIPLLKNKNQPDCEKKTPLMIAAGAGVLSVVRYLSELSDCTESYDKKGHSALHYAALNNETTVIEYLQKQGYPINQTEAPGNHRKPYKNVKRTPLHLAAWKGHERAVQTLLDSGADYLQEDAMGNTVYEYAVKSKHSGVLELVQNLLGEQYHKRRTQLLNAAATADHVDMAALLILSDTNLNAVNKYGLTALHMAAMHNSGEMAAILLKGDDLALDALCEAGYTPLHYAAETGHVRLIKLLCEAGAQVNNANSQQPAALFKACERGHPGAVSLLLKYQADFTKTNAQGLTPGQVALLNGHTDIAHKLRSAGDKSLESGKYAELLKIKPEPPIKMGNLLLSHGLYRPKTATENKNAASHSFSSGIQ